jgi:uncharacterized protein YqeY
MPLKERIQQDMKDAMRSGDKPRLATIRLILAAIKQTEIDERCVLEDDRVTAVLDKMARQRRESISQFEKAGRNDLVAQEAGELALIQGYLPEQLGEDELADLVDAAITVTGAASMRDMGKVMGKLKPQLQGRADMSAVSAMVRDRLGRDPGTR